MNLTNKTFSPIDGPDGHEIKKSYELSLGLEIEFSVATLRSTQQDPFPEDPRTAYGILHPGMASEPHNINSTETHIALSLNEAFKEDQMMFWNRQTDTILPHHFRATGGDVEPIGFNENTQWLIKTDVSIEPPALDDPLKPHIYTFVPIEIISPAYVFSEEALNQVQRVVKHLSNTYRISITDTCGMHVHIGQQNASYSLPHLKKICAILWTFEHMFYLFVRKSRWSNTQCLYLTQDSYLAQRFGGDGPATMRGGLEKILSVTSVNQLCEMLSHNFRRLGFNLRNLDNEEAGFDPLKQTIEVRLHESTLDPEAIYHWIHVFIGLVKFADVVNTTNLEKWLRDHVEDGFDVYDPFQLLNALKLPHQAGYYATEILLRLDDEGWETSLGKAAQAELGIQFRTIK